MLRLPVLLALAAVACAGEDERPAKWSYIHAAIIMPNCATSSCHSELTQVSGVNLEDRQKACESTRDAVPVLRGAFRDKPKMPPDEPLPEVDIDIIQAWIDAGASCD